MAEYSRYLSVPGWHNLSIRPCTYQVVSQLSASLASRPAPLLPASPAPGPRWPRSEAPLQVRSKAYPRAPPPPQTPQTALGPPIAPVDISAPEHHLRPPPSTSETDSPSHFSIPLSPGQSASQSSTSRTHHPAERVKSRGKLCIATQLSLPVYLCKSSRR